MSACEGGCHWVDARKRDLCSACVEKVQKVTPEEASAIIENREPLGLFYIKEKDVYVGIDNWDGNAWTEEFKSLGACKRWLLKG